MRTIQIGPFIISLSKSEETRQNRNHSNRSTGEYPSSTSAYVYNQRQTPNMKEEQSDSNNLKNQENLKT